ncbi:MAG: zf-TFIIB domain-containing protein [Myxococcota bacterium]
MSVRKPSSGEEEFFAREEAKRKELEAIRRGQAKAESERAVRRGTCPGGCEPKLIEEAFRDILIDRCPSCGGVWLDPGELEKISSDDANVVRSFFNFFAGRPE